MSVSKMPFEDRGALSQDGQVYPGVSSKSFLHPWRKKDDTQLEHMNHAHDINDWLLMSLYVSYLRVS